MKKLLFLGLTIVLVFGAMPALASEPATPRQFKQVAKDALSALLPTGDKKTDRRIEKAIEHIEKSLDPNLWETDETLTKKGKKVFDREKKAVKELMKIDAPDVSDAIDALVGADAALAQGAIDEAIAEGGDAKEIAKAEKEMAKAQEERDKGKYDKAIDHYKKAWEHAQKAMKKPPKVWVDDDYTPATPGWGVTRFDKIQDGIDAVTDGGTVHVANGDYNATSSPFVRITKPLRLIGESRDGVVLDGTGTSTIAWAKGIHVTANDVTIKNLTVQNFGALYYWGYGVLFRDYAHDMPAEGYIYYTGCVVENVKSQYNCYPMYALVNRNLTIRNSLIQNNLGDGMFIARESDNATITGNMVINSGDHGIWVGKCWMGLGPSDNVTITNNTVNGAREGGISFVGSDGATISGNTITNVAAEGWSVGALNLKDGSSNVEAYNNAIYNNDGSWGGYSGTGHGVGIDGTPSNIVLHWNSIYGNAGYGCYNYSTVHVDAENNWWGDPSGPSGVGPGSGDEVSAYVDFDPWLSEGPFHDRAAPLGLVHSALKGKAGRCPHEEDSPPKGEGTAKVIASVGSYALCQNYPNPCNPETHIRYSLAETGSVTLKVYNLRGQLVRTLVHEVRSSGTYSVRWDGRDNRGIEVSSGIYLYRLEAGQFAETKRMLLLK